MFYFYFESRNDPDNDPLVIWMTGALLLHIVVNAPYWSLPNRNCTLADRGNVTQQTRCGVQSVPPLQMV
jgi:Serine carboxypeptidase